MEKQAKEMKAISALRHLGATCAVASQILRDCHVDPQDASHVETRQGKRFAYLDWAGPSGDFQQGYACTLVEKVGNTLVVTTNGYNEIISTEEDVVYDISLGRC